MWDVLIIVQIHVWHRAIVSNVVAGKIISYGATSIMKKGELSHWPPIDEYLGSNVNISDKTWEWCL